MHLVETVADVAKLQVANPEQLAYVSQTTLSVDDTADDHRGAQARFPHDHRAEEGRHLLRHHEPPGSREVHGAAGRRGDRRRQPEQLELATACAKWPKRWARRPTWSTTPRRSIRPGSTGKPRIGVTAGASAPEVLVQAVIDRLKELGASSVRALEGVEEHVTFPLPKGPAMVRRSCDGMIAIDSLLSRKYQP